MTENAQKNQEKFFKNLIMFEQQGLEYLAAGDKTQAILTGPNAIQAKLDERTKETLEKQKNPFQATWIWLKGEILDIKGMIDAINGRESLVQV